MFWAESGIREEADITKAEVGGNAKYETEAAERAKASAKVEAKEKTYIATVASNARKKAESKAA